MTLTSLLAELYRRLNYASTPDAAVTTRLTSFLNIMQRQILTTPGLESLRDDTVTFASVAAQALYGLPPSVAHIQGISERTNNIRLGRESLGWLRQTDPGLTASGTSSVYVPRGLQQVAKQPSTAASLFVDSTAAGDVGTAYIEGYRTGGYFKSVSKAMTGATGVDVSTATTDWIEVTKFYLSVAAIGTVTLTEAAEAGTILATIPIGQTYARYQGVQLWPTPAAVVTYYVDYVRAIQDMSIGTDEPLLSEDYHWLLIAGARMLEYEKQNDTTRYLIAQRELADGMKKLRFDTHQNVVGTPNLRGGLSQRPSQLGGWFPANS